MTRIRFAVLVSGASAVLACAPAFAHHSFAAEFDERQPITISGCVTKVEWMNPHAHFYLEVKDAQGKVTNWDFELGSPNALMHEGWMRGSLKPGDDVTVQGYRAKDGSNLVNAKTVKLADGRSVLTGSSAPGGGTH
jgi:Family of unknown function (DUF6152)